MVTSMRKRGGESWNSELIPCGQDPSLILAIARKLEGICQSLILPAGQGNAIKFLTNTETVQRIDTWVEDVHEALMTYHVCNQTTCFFLA